MKIAIFTDAYFPHISGVVTVVDQQTQKLAQKGHKIKIFCPKFKKKDKSNLQLPKNIEVVRLPANISVLGYSTLPLSIPTVTKSLKQIRKFNPDIIHIHTEGGVGWEGLICAKIRKTPIVTTLHTFLAHQEYLKNLKMDKLETFQKIGWKYILMIHNQAKLVICPSKAMQNEAFNNGLEVPTKIIANGIDLTKYKNSNQNSKKNSSKNKSDLNLNFNSNFQFIYVGRVAVEKSLDVLIKAFKIIHRKHPKTKLTIIGGGPALAELRMLVNEQNLAGNIIFTGQIPHDQLINSDLIVLATALESSDGTKEMTPTVKCYGGNGFRPADNRR